MFSFVKKWLYVLLMMLFGQIQIVHLNDQCFERVLYEQLTTIRHHTQSGILLDVQFLMLLFTTWGLYESLEKP